MIATLADFASTLIDHHDDMLVIGQSGLPRGLRGGIDLDLRPNTASLVNSDTRITTATVPPRLTANRGSAIATGNNRKGEQANTGNCLHAESPDVRDDSEPHLV